MKHPPQQQGERGSDGRFMPGHSVGKDSRFEPGVSGNPGGAPAGKAQPSRWLAALADESPDELQRIVDERDGSASRIAAARLILDTLDDDPNVRRRAFDALCDRVEGRAIQRASVSEKGATQSVEECLIELRRRTVNPRPTRRPLPTD